MTSANLAWLSESHGRQRIIKVESKVRRFEPPAIGLLHEEVTSSLFRAILEGSIKPGERLKEDAIAQELGVSRSPVRRAFQEMARQGILVLAPRKGARVASWTLADLEDFWHIRLFLEGFAAEQATSRIEAHELEAAFHLTEESIRAPATLSIEDTIEMDIGFHSLIIRASRNRSLISAYESLMLRTKMFMIAEKHFYPSPSGLQTAIDHHLQIANAMKAGDGMRARELMERHISEVSKGLATRMGAVSADIVGENVPQIISRMKR